MWFESVSNSSIWLVLRRNTVDMEHITSFLYLKKEKILNSFFSITITSIYIELLSVYIIQYTVIYKFTVKILGGKFRPDISHHQAFFKKLN